MVNRKNKHVTLSELSIILKHSGPHMALSRLVTLSISDFVIWILRLINSMIELIDCMMQHFIPGDTFNMLFGHI